jgi:hypothetical protein
MLDHAAYLVRDGLNPAACTSQAILDAMPRLGGHDAEGRQAANPAEGRRSPRHVSYIAFAPARGVPVFVALNKFDFAAVMGMAKGRQRADRASIASGGVGRGLLLGQYRIEGGGIFGGAEFFNRGTISQQPGDAR